jgi:preprotein translocase subunit SecF
MQIFKHNTHIPFVRYRYIAMTISLVLILTGIVSLIIHGGPNYGIDFRGGTLVQVKIHKSTDISHIRESLKGLKLGEVVIQSIGAQAQSEYLIRIEKSSTSLKGVSELVKERLIARFGEKNVEIRRVEMVGPKVGKDLRRKGLWAILFALVAILIYITWRFEFWFAIGAIVALAHDVLITVGVFSITNKQVNLAIVAAVLTIIGYSLNDTIVVYDRIRENMKKLQKISFSDMVNQSINETLSRTILTSVTTLITVVILFILGGEVIRNFAFALIVGVVVGTYSSIYIASPVVLFFEPFGNKHSRSSRPSRKSVPSSTGKSEATAAKPSLKKKKSTASKKRRKK